MWNFLCLVIIAPGGHGQVGWMPRLTCPVSAGSAGNFIVRRKELSPKVISSKRGETVYIFLLRSWRKGAFFSRKLDIFKFIR
jgi:hypothetical protein